MSPKDLEYVASRFQSATVLVGTLVAPAADFSSIEDIRVACLEDWFTNYRLLAEFLICAQKGGPTPQMFAPGWSAEGKPWRNRLGKEYHFASVHVAHLWGPEGEAEEPFNPATPAKQVADMKARAEFLLDVIVDFVDAVRPRDGSHAEVMRDGIALARRALARLG
jgi:hypothetical protein